MVSLPPGAQLDEHFHKEREESYLVIGGRGKAIVSGKEVVLEKGDLVTVSPGEPHRLVAHPNETFEYLVITAPAWTPYEVHPT